MWRERKKPLALHSVDALHAYLIARGLLLGGVVLFLAVIGSLLALAGEKSPYLWTAFFHGRISLQELVRLEWGSLLIAGLFSWGIFHARMMRWAQLRVLLPTGLAALVLFYFSMTPGKSFGPTNFFPILIVLLLFMFLYPSLSLLRSFVKLCRSRRIRLLGLIYSVLIWAGLTSFFFPEQRNAAGGNLILLLLSSMGISAFILAPYFILLLKVSESRGEGNSASTALRGKAVLLVVLGLVFWLGLHREASWEKQWREQGLPTSLEELNAPFNAQAPDENPAFVYIDLAQEKRAAELAWGQELIGDPEESAKRLNHHPPNEVWRHFPQESGEALEMLFNPQKRYVEVELYTADAQWLGRYYDKIGRAAFLKLQSTQRDLGPNRFPVGGDQAPFSDSQAYRDYLSQLNDLCMLEMLMAAEAQSVTRVLGAYEASSRLADDASMFTGFSIAHHAHYCRESAFKHLQAAIGKLRLDREPLEALATGLAAIAAAGRWEALQRQQTFDLVISYHCTSAVDPIKRLFAVYPKSRRKPASPRYRQFQTTIGNILAPVYYAQKTSDRKLQYQLDRYHRLPEANQSLDAHRNIELFEPGLRAVLKKIWQPRLMLEILSTALAVERFRLEEGRLPERLEAITPAYLPEIPRDIWNYGAPLSYRIREDGGFTVYSLGEKRIWRSSTEREPVSFTIAPPEARGL